MIYVLCLRYTQSYINIQIYGQTHNFINVYIVSLVGSDNWKRSYELYKTWGQEFVEKFHGVFKFSSSSMNKSFENITLYNPNVRSYGYIKLFHLFNDAVKDFLENTNLQWIYRTTEDCFVNLELFEKFMTNFSSIHDPNLELIVKGHAIKNSRKLYFIHGGSGWFMSRAAAKMYYDLIPIIEPYQIQNSITDDVLIYNFTKRMNLTCEDVNLNEFLGTALSDDDIIRLANGNFTDVPYCSKRKSFYDDLRRMKDIIFWHSGKADNFPMYHGKEVYPLMKDNLYFQRSLHYTGLCLMNETNSYL